MAAETLVRLEACPQGARFTGRIESQPFAAVYRMDDGREILHFPTSGWYEVRKKEN